MRTRNSGLPIPSCGDNIMDALTQFDPLVREWFNSKFATVTAPHILVTTPESLYILLTAEGPRKMLSSVRTLIVDEIHAVADDKRGSHLALSIARLESLVGRRLQKIGLSATVSPIEEVAKFLS